MNGEVGRKKDGAVIVDVCIVFKIYAIANHGKTHTHKTINKRYRVYTIQTSEIEVSGCISGSCIVGSA